MKPSQNEFRVSAPARPFASAALFLLGILILLPILAAGSELFLVDGQFSFKNFEVVLFNARQWNLLGNSLFVAGGAALIALGMGIPFAILVSRTRVPGRAIFLALGATPLLLPPLISAIAWVGLWKIKGPLWAALLFAFSYFPFVWILTARALERIDRRIEESARLSGGWKAAWKVQAPLVLPSSLIGALLVFVFSIADFSVPDYLSTVGTKFNVYADDIFFRWKQENKSGEAIAASLPPLLMISLALFGIMRLRKRSEGASQPGFQSPQRIALRAWNWPAFFFCLIVVALSCGIVLFQLFREAGGIQSYLEAARTARADLLHSVLFSAAAALFACLLQVFPAYLASRSTRWRWIDECALLPLALPALLLAIGMIRVWNRPGPILDWSDWIYATPVVVILLYTTRFFAFSYYTSRDAFHAQGNSLEESAAVCGIPWKSRLWKIVLPPAFPALASGALLVFLFSMREIDSVALIPAGNPTIMFRIYNYVHFGRDSLIAALCLLSFFLIAFPLLMYRLWFVKPQETTRED